MPLRSEKHRNITSDIRDHSGSGLRRPHIVIRTTYQIEVDGTPVTGHMGVTDDGKVHYHPVPNISFASALDMVKQLIDVFPDDFTDTGENPLRMKDTRPQRMKDLPPSQTPR